MSPAELAVHRLNTKHFINADPITVALVPQAITRGHSGTKMTPGTPRDAQTFRLIPINDITPEVQTPDGVQLTPTYVLLGAFDCFMERWDTFLLNGKNYQITSPIRPTHTVESRYEAKADVALR